METRNSSIQGKNADMMVLKTTRKLRVMTAGFKQGQRVTVYVPKIDRQGLQSPRLPGMVSRVMENGYYEIMTSGGTINRMFRADELSAYSGQFVISSISNDRISLRAAAIYFNNNKRNSKVGRKKKQLLFHVNV